MKTGMRDRIQSDGYVPLEAGPSTSSAPAQPVDYKLKQRPSARGDGKEAERQALKRSSSGFKASALPGSQLPQGIRQKDKFVPLPLDSRGGSPSRIDELDAEAISEVTVVPDGASGGRISTAGIIVGAARGRITVYCLCEGLDRPKLESLIRIKHPSWTTHAYSDVLHAQLPVGVEELAHGITLQDVFFFEYGVIAFWGLQVSQEHVIIQSLCRPSERYPLPPDEIDIDEFTFNYSINEPPHIQNDTITINRRQAADHQVRLAISHALAQSTKLRVYEDRVVALVEESKHLPQDLATHGRVSMTSKRLAQLIGKVFLQSSTLNLLGSVVDTPEFFWSAPDQLQALYDRACEYLELDTRAEVLNARFQVLQEMLDMLRDHKNNSHAARMEWIVIWLLVVDVVLMLFQLLSLFGFV